MEEEELIQKNIEEEELIRKAKEEIEKPVLRCGYQDCKEVAINRCAKCRRPICARHTIKPGLLYIFCPDCYYKKEVRRSCFIATAAYGTPFAKEVDILRCWRDNFLCNKKIGRLLVGWYYVVSPPIANIISKSGCLRLIIRALLNPIVKFLKKYLRNRTCYSFP